ncbi:glycoside hydrolase family 15 protein [Streptomyces ochraceiscleroticus]|uniref:glycoside hydrolase family 15 protein n=1 Tax=Streptomyces ochraceiscleroticus TaxID=47761 RepID=UPI0004C63306|nr:glycoside hydrolase family 15 protein [Streptomyces ochraceiscleroticus]
MPGRIEDYGIVGDLETAALVGRDGSVDWLCLPRFDSPAAFAGLLGTDGHGHWRIAPAGPPRHCTRRGYTGDTLVLESLWETPGGTVRVLDFMPPRDRAPRLIRIVEGLSGEVPMYSALRLRFNYGRVLPWVRRTGHHRIATAGPDSGWLRVPPGVHTFGTDGATCSEFTVRAGDRVPFVLTWQPSHVRSVQVTDPERALRDTAESWQRWAATCRYEGEWRPDVVRSLITLKALAYRPTGGIVAAPTTSLPEAIGAPRNWDYRFCWLRDSSMTLSALLRGGFHEEAAAWRRWLVRAIAGDPADLQTLYGLAGERRLPESTAPWLPGYEGSGPVRLGNAAVDQFQLDVYGEVADTLYLAQAAGIPMERRVWTLFRTLMDALEQRWREPDEGLWEMRCGRRHFVHSKVMAWVAADRAVRLAEKTGLPAPLARWRTLRDAVHADVCAHGYDADRGVFVQHYGSRELDAATLFIVKTGFLPPDDPRVIRTVDAVRTELDHDGFLRRYSDGGPDSGACEGVSGDGLPGTEGAFLACSFWLADALLATGRHAEARALFARTLALGNDLGLFAEEWDGTAGRQLGNVPQAFTHVALVNSAFDLAAAGADRSAM